MHTTFKLSADYLVNDSLVIIIDDEKKLPGFFFSEEELNYIKSEFGNEKKNVVINRYKHLYCVHLIDKKKSATAIKESARKAGDLFVSAFNRHKFAHAAIVDFSENAEAVLALAEGVGLGNYDFLRYKKDKKKEAHAFNTLLINSKKLKDKDIELLQIAVDAVCHARDLVNTPQSSQTAEDLSKEFVKLGKQAGFKVEVFNKSKIKALGMGGLLAVNLGSINPPTFTVMEWKPKNAKNKKPYIIIGKGVVYDTGGLSLKPTGNSMDYMKSDMAGSAAVACAMYAIAKAKLPVHMVALVPATDNRPGGNAYAPGDVINMMDGQTVEMLNADAEGRMILADALHYAKRYAPQLVMDFATLTGAAAAAVGPYGIVCMGTADEKTKKKLSDSGENVYERLAEFPFWDEYDELIKSDIADMKNIGGPIAGAITAGKFLQRYTDYPWMHFDIAGPSFLHKGDSYRGKNGSGVGVRLLFDFFSNL